MDLSLHTEAICWLRYGKRIPIVCTEVGPWHADVIGLSDKMSIEVEIKKSRSDLLAEFKNKKAKHFAYANADGANRAGPFVPNYMYFYVPAALGDFAVQTLETLCPKAGVAIQTDTKFLDGKNTEIIKKPTRLRPECPSPVLFRTAMYRMSSELCGRYVALETLNAKLGDVIVTANKAAINAAARAAGTLDPEDRQSDLKFRAAELAFAVECVQDFDTLSDDRQQYWKDAAQRLLEAQFLNSESFKNATLSL
jgi:hypothetical protein